MLLITGEFTSAKGQRFHTINQAEDTLSIVLASINQTRDDSAKQLLNQTFSAVLYDALKLSSADNYPFDSLKSLVKIASPDNKFRIFHWNLPSNDGIHHYFGFIKILDHDPPLIFPLVDFSDSLTMPDTALLDNQHWFGALYYKIIPGQTASGEKIYTLLGWAGKNSVITKKIIEVLRFDAHDSPYFGLKIFPGYLGGNMARIIFRFAATTSMSMKYEKQTITSNKKWNKNKRIFEYSLNETPMIVCDRMIPLDPQLEGQYQFYVAAGDICDGFVFQDHCWKFVAGIDSRNRK